MPLDSASIKRELLQQSDISGIRKRLEVTITKDREQEIIESADALERMTGQPGWTVLEVYMMKVVMDSLLKDEGKDLSKGMINVMHFVDQMIRMRNDIFARREKENGVAQG